MQPLPALLLLFATAVLGALPHPAAAGEDRVPFPAELQQDVDFWIRVYSEISTSEGFLHDERDLSIVYRKLQFERDIEPRARRDAVDAERKKIEAMLRRLASGASGLSDEEKRIKDAFGASGTPARFREAAAGVRFQLGQSDRFRAGLERSGIWEGHIAQTFANLGLPPELAALPHVESSFDPTAYSKVGAAGMWQFMPATGKRYLRIDDAVDERMDPFRATEAAAQLLDYNYRLLGSWPLALTAYNHGAAGMRRARDAMGTTDIATIVRKYRGPSFGFASRNFYVSFLAALTIDRDPEKYFPGITRRPELEFTEVVMPAYIPANVLQEKLGISRAELAALNPALMPPVWDGRQHVPKGYRLRLPPSAGQWSTQQVALRVEQKDQFAGQPRPRTYQVRSGDTLSGVAARHGLTVRELASLNDLSTQAMLRIGQTLRLPQATPAAPAVPAPASAQAPAPVVVAATAGASAPVAVARVEAPPRQPAPEQVARVLESQRAEAAAVARINQRAEEAEPVSASEASAESPALVPGGAVARATESIDFHIGEDGSIRVAADETIGHYADWLGIPASRVRSLNGLSPQAAVPLGRTLKLDFSKVSREAFDQKRRTFHETLQAGFFAGHRITGTSVYVTRRGDSLWSIAQRNGTLPTWLVLHYNPDIDFAALRAGQEIVIPKVEALPPA